jgi:predicted nucleic-acid-binding protein
VIALDTNVLVRFLVDSQDEPSQSLRARALVQGAMDRGENVLIPLVTVVETVWVRRKVGAFAREEVVRTLRSLLASPTFEFVQRAHVEVALVAYAQSKGDFADHVISAEAAADSAVVYTFDRALHGLAGFAEP